jgi:hypothetical protein
MMKLARESSYLQLVNKFFADKARHLDVFRCAETGLDESG